jgi:glutaredoxin
MRRVVQRISLTQPLAAGLLLAVATASAWAQYRVVGPDGRVTFTDRPPMEANSRVEPLRGPGSAGAAAPASALPFELQRVVQQFPVTLYTASKCGTCGEARNLLRQRGVPFSERLIESEADLRAFAAISRDQAVPTLRIGSQVVSGFEASEWTSYLNAAGYPATSRLPANYQNPAPAPLVARTEPAARPGGRADGAADSSADSATGAAPGQAAGPGVTRRGSAGPVPTPSEPPLAPSNPSGIRF